MTRDDRVAVVPYTREELGVLPGHLRLVRWGDDEEEPPAEIGEARFYVPPYLRSFDPRTLEVMASMPHLEVVQTLTAGFEHVVPHLPHGVTLCNARGLHDTATAELAVALTLAAQNDLVGFARDADDHRWDFRQRRGLADQTVLVVGYGAIGQAISRRLAPFECQVVPVARTPRPATGSEPAVAGWHELPALVPQADIVVLIVPGNAETRHLVDAEFLARMRDGALLVNVARGAVVDTDALLAELQSGRLRAAVDVTDPEPLPAGHPLWEAPNLLLTPHVGGWSGAFRPRAEALLAAQLRRWAAGEPLSNVVAS
ncbi:MAG: 2-hydroxyacid dehydrogenase [Actinomycetes bacterium]